MQRIPSGSARRGWEFRVFQTVIMLVVVLCLSAAMLAQGPKPGTPAAKPATEPEKSSSPTPSSAPELTAADVSAFLDGIMPQQLAREDIAGAVVLVVKDGKVLFAKGYGLSNVEKHTPVSPDSTLFRPGSISKLFTWTAVMQQVEQGKLDLDRDVNDYLDFKIEPKFGKPITLRNIMTHTSGFQETIDGLFVNDYSHMHPLGDYLKAHQPARIFPPGTTPAYSNYATALAGYIVQRVSGMPLDDYIEKNILEPLNMKHSTFRQPLPDALKDMMSNGYELASKKPKPFEIVQAWPAGSASVTAADMANFMMAHLQNGQFEGKEILKPETAKLMHSAAFENAPGMNSMALGFYEETRNGHRIIGHGGDTMCFHSDLHLVPDANVGFFVSYNSAGKGEASPRTAVWHAFLDRYYPYQPPAADKAADPPGDAKAVAGYYVGSRGFETNFMRLFSVIGDPKVYANEDGTISIDMLKDMNGQPKKFREIGPMVFREEYGQDKLAFVKDYQGGRRLVIDYPFMVFTQASGADNGLVLKTVLYFSLAAIILTLLFWPIGGLIRRHYSKPLEMTPELKRLRLWTRFTCLAIVLFVIAFAIFLTTLMSSIGDASAAVRFLLTVGQLFGWLAVIGTIAALYYGFRSWTASGRGLCSKLGDTITVLGCVCFVWLAFAYHMLTFYPRY